MNSGESLTTNPVTCPDCKNRFLQPFVCTTCGAQKLYDETVRSQAATIDRLTAEVAELRLSADANLYVAQQHMLRESVMASEVAELRRDAERYRWLRDHWWLDDKADATPAPMMNAQSPEQFDAAIDAALGDSRDA